VRSLPRRLCCAREPRRAAGERELVHKLVVPPSHAPGVQRLSALEKELATLQAGGASGPPSSTSEADARLEAKWSALLEKMQIEWKEENVMLKAALDKEREEKADAAVKAAAERKRLVEMMEARIRRALPRSLAFAHSLSSTATRLSLRTPSAAR
jgi:hypothetical protein